ncbi:ABC1 kinase family protein [Humibacter sp.]|jgi:predicted unusual protein kinase regulating ubiquinone biosynthesis (AarF/ABC1/UbiB family)|uniref:ABC1 kinase family protein n=1 Tax=Humibacter sp. TaxID=1940291 RepID=UPI002B52B021|nr:AarF/UbiB family protein [Humibacter sp.]HVX07814.1 AarF/UbiB family protein [Humibacter sp.]
MAPALEHPSKSDDSAERSRYRRILRFALRTLLQVWWFEVVLPRIGLERLAERRRTERLIRVAQRFRMLAVELGGLMIKVGQFLSSRLDVLPPEITSELAGLQDEVPAAPFSSILPLAEAELGVPLARAYSSFDPSPVAAASLGQAHRATLVEQDAAALGFERVVVKVQRPGIRAIVDVDLAALRRVAGWLSHLRVVSDHVDPRALVAEFAATSIEEIDYLHEAAGAERFAEMFADDARVSVPEIVWERTTRRVLTLSDVTAIKINDVDALRAAGIDPHEVATVFAEVMFEQLFGHGYFHADPHPGNLFVTPVEGPVDDGSPAWRLTFVDFGMMGEVTDELRDGLRKLLIAVAARDGRGLIEGIQNVGILLPTADTAELERAMTRLFDRFGGMGFAQLRKVDQREFRDFGREFGAVVRSLPFQLPENFLLVIRSMSLTSGVCSALDPEFNIWEAIEPYASDLLRKESGNVVIAAAREALSAAGVVLRLPGRIDQLITRIDAGMVTVATPAIDRRLGRIERLARRAVGSVLFAGFLIGGILLIPTATPLGIVLTCVSALPLLYVLFTGTPRPPGR